MKIKIIIVCFLSMLLSLCLISFKNEYKSVNIQVGRYEMINDYDILDTSTGIVKHYNTLYGKWECK